MKKTIALALALVLTLSLVAMPASAATRAIINGYCTHCERAAEYRYRYDEGELFYVQICFEYFEPHYHSPDSVTYCVRCTNDKCVCYNIDVDLEDPVFYDRCHYGE